MTVKIRTIGFSVAAVLTTSIVAHAFDTSWISTGQPVSSSKLKAVITEMEARLASLETGTGGGTPAGTIIAFAGPICPTGYIAADGASLSRTGTYAGLFAASQTAWGSTDSTHFNVPNLANRFLRGAGAPNDGNGGDAVVLGAYQSDDLVSHSHGAGSLTNASSTVGGTVGGSDGTHTHGDNGHVHQEQGDPTFNTYGPNNGPGQSTVYALTTGGPAGAMNQSTLTASANVNASGSGHGHAFSLTAAAQLLSGATALSPVTNGRETRPKAYAVTFCIRF